MILIKKLIGILTTLLVSLFLFPQQTLAVCPVCTVAVGAGVGLSRYLGIDDTVTGLWVGGLTVSMIAWTINWLNGKKIHFKFRKILTTVFYYLVIVIPLYWTGIMGHPYNKILGMDKLLVGIGFGSVGFLAGTLFNNYLKKKNNNHVYFPFQRVIMPVGSLIILSLIFWYVAKK